MLNAWGNYSSGICPRNILFYENLVSKDCWEREYEKLAIILGLGKELGKEESGKGDGEEGERERRERVREVLSVVKERCLFGRLRNETVGRVARGLNVKWVQRNNKDINSAKVFFILFCFLFGYCFSSSQTNTSFFILDPERCGWRIQKLSFERRSRIHARKHEIN